MNIVVWVSVLTFHQSHLLRELAKLDSVDVHVVVGVDMIEERIQQGWRPADTTGLTTTNLRGGESPLSTGLTVLRNFDNAIHLFGGLWADRYFPGFIAYAAIKKIPFGLISEPFMDKSLNYFDDNKSLVSFFKNLVRPAAYRLAGLMIARRTGPVFAISRRSEEQFLKMKFPEENIFPWGYFVARNDVGQSYARGHSLRIVYIGTLIKRKGLDRLLRALAVCKYKDLISVDVYGPADALQVKILEDEGGHYKGTIPFGEAQAVICRYDLLVLPSRFDGWGVVVNEALLQGVPALVDEMVGARCMIKASEAGAILRFEDTDEVSAMLDSLASGRLPLSVWRANAAAYSQVIEPEYAAKYFRDCILSWFGEGPRPKCSWSEHDNAAHDIG